MTGPEANTAEAIEAARLSEESLVVLASQLSERGTGTAAALDRIAFWASAIAAGGIGTVGPMFATGSSSSPAPGLRWAVFIWLLALAVTAIQIVTVMRLRSELLEFARMSRNLSLRTRLLAQADVFQSPAARNAVQSIAPERPRNGDFDEARKRVFALLPVATWAAYLAVGLAIFALVVALVALGALPF